MAEDVREVLSDVHVYNKYELQPDSSLAVSRLKFRCPKPVKESGARGKAPLITKDENLPDNDLRKRNQRKRNVDEDEERDDGTEKCLVLDEDGDPVLLRRSEWQISTECGAAEYTGSDTYPDVEQCLHVHDKDTEEVETSFDSCIIIEHSLVTNLNRVGEQVWLGAFLLCDFILDNRQLFTGATVVDLGSGTGLTSIVAALFSDRVFSTDVGENVLGVALSNTERQHDLPSGVNCPSSTVAVRELDWFSGLQVKDDTAFGFSASEVEEVSKATVLLAADVVYDDNLTDAFFKTIKQLMSVPPCKTLFISIEKRLVFTLDDLDVASPGYNHFRQCLSALSQATETGPVYRVEELGTNFPLYFDYNRVRQLELWKINTDFPGR